MRLGGRLTGHFLGRVALLLAALGTVFLAWIAVVALFTFSANSAGGVSGASTSQLVREASLETTLLPDGRVALSGKMISDARRAATWVQVLNEQGIEETSTGRPANVPTRYTPGKLVLYREQPVKLGMRSVSTWSTQIGGRDLTLVAGRSGKAASGPVTLLDKRVTSPAPRTLLSLLIGLLVVGGVVTLGIALLFGRSLSKPLVHMMDWLSALARGDYAEPVDRRGRPVSRSPGGLGLRPPYATYREVFGSLETLTSELRSTAEERERIESARDEWLASVSHDLRTPLTSVKGYAQMLASDYDFDPAEVRAHAALIVTQGSHMDELLDDMNLSFRLRSDALVLEKRQVDVVELAREAAVDLANDPRSSAFEVVFDEPAGSGEILISGDIGLLRRAVANLLVNAVVHNPAGTTVRVGVSREGGWVLVRVSDDGVGLDESTSARLFDRYFRGTSTGASEGSGLGMAISRQIVVAHGGRIDVASIIGRGTTVQIALPSMARPAS